MYAFCAETKLAGLFPGPGRGEIMSVNGDDKKNVDPTRMNVLRSLPQSVKDSLTKEEVDAFLYSDDWPESLLEKLKEFIVEE